jgi:hypothetical protein
MKGSTGCVALVTCAELSDADADTRLLIAPLAARGLRAAAVTWDDPAVDWSRFDLAVVRSCWDYSERREEFLAWAARVPRLANPRSVLLWNTDKRYLAELAAKGISVVPTTWLQPGDSWRVPRTGEQRVVKPAVSLAALDTGRYDFSDHEHRRLAYAHVRRLQQAGRVVMIQPYVAHIETEGETSLVFIAGCFSHAVRKAPVLDGPDCGIDRRFVPDGGVDPQPCTPSPAQLDVAERALNAVPGGGRHDLLYARVDVVPGDDGAPLIMEVELTEPHLYLGRVPKAVARLASAIAARVAR